MTEHANRLHALLRHVETQGCSGFLIPMADEYQSEYPPDSARRIAFMCGFTGSAGLIVTLNGKAAFFTDSRYTLQAERQVPRDLYVTIDSARQTPAAWLKEVAPAGTTIGFDPWLHTMAGIARLDKALQGSGIVLKAIQDNPVDRLWSDRPAPPMTPAVPHDLRYAGQASSDKRQAVARTLRQDGHKAVIITDTASIAWLLNVRGNDTPHTPLPLSRAILHDTGHVDWFIDARKTRNPDLAAHLGQDVTLRAPDDFPDALKALAQTGGAIRLDPQETPYAIALILKNAGTTMAEADDPSALPRACKNRIELDGMRAAHRRDGVALARFLCWLDDAMASGEPLDEVAIGQKVDTLRAQDSLHRGPSFDTIAGYGPNGAVVHYRAMPDSAETLRPTSFLLLDSGGQYLDGTTDVTRTIALGPLTDEERRAFTLVLQGHIALASARFPSGIAGCDLDVLARRPLWAEGLDYGHGTGHGVGSYLGVHEGPQGISRRNTVPLVPGMILSNEPGYYKAGAFGIRIENLVAVVERPEKDETGKPFLGFETLTQAPIDRRAIAPDMLTAPERAWLNAYHARVYENLAPLLEPTVAAWLKEATRTI